VGFRRRIPCGSGKVGEAPRSRTESRGEADKVALASGKAFTAAGAQPQFTSQVAKTAGAAFTACLMCLSETALQTHMIMGAYL